MNTTSQPSELPSSRFIFLTLSLTLAVLIIVGNAFVIAAYRKNSRLRTRTNVFIVSLGVSDLLVGAVSVPIWIYFTMVGWRYQMTGLFEFYKSFDVFSALASIFHLTAISVERFLAVARPFKYAELSSRFYERLLIAAWIAAAILAAISQVNSSIIEQKTFYTAVVFVIGFVAPAFAMTVMYTSIFCSARSLIRRTPSMNSTDSSRTKARDERKVAMTVGVVTVLFLLAWLPFFVSSMLAQFCGVHCFPKGDGLAKLVTFMKWMHYSNSAVNPAVYALRDKEIRLTFMRFLRIRTKKRRRRCEIASV